MEIKTSLLNGLVFLIPLFYVISGCVTQHSIYEIDDSKVNVGEEIELKFEWPDGLEGRVQSSLKKTQTGPKGTKTRSMEAECTMRTEKTPDGLRIYCENMTWDGDRAIKAFLEGAPGLMSPPAFSVNSEGVITEFEGLNEVRKAMEPILERAEGLPPAARKQIENLLEPEILANIFNNEWSTLVPFWHGAELETGSWYELRQSFPMPISGDMIEWTQEFTLAGRVPCDRKDSGMNCVKLILVSKPDKEQFEEVVEKMTKNMFPGSPGERPSPGLIIREVEYKFTLVTRPERLLPYWVEETRFIQMEATGADGETKTMDVLDERKHLYEYTTIP